MTTLLLVSSRSTPVLHEKVRQVTSRRAQVLGVERTQRRVTFDVVVKGVDELDENRVAADLIEERFTHALTLMA